MYITCHTLEAFIETVAGLVAKGLTFKACTDTLTIKLTGGF